jgi:hypothetical protein
MSLIPQFLLVSLLERRCCVLRLYLPRVKPRVGLSPRLLRGHTRHQAPNENKLYRIEATATSTARTTEITTGTKFIRGVLSRCSEDIGLYCLTHKPVPGREALT